MAFPHSSTNGSHSVLFCCHQKEDILGMMDALCSQRRQCKERKDVQGKLLIDILEKNVTKLGNTERL